MVFLVLWIVLCECARIFVLLLRREPLLGWAVGPFGVTLMVLHEPSLLYIWLDVSVPPLSRVAYSMWVCLPHLALLYYQIIC